jgi:hypothetical protein
LKIFILLYLLGKLKLLALFGIGIYEKNRKRSMKKGYYEFEGHLKPFEVIYLISKG